MKVNTAFDKHPRTLAEKQSTSIKILERCYVCCTYIAPYF